MSIPVVYSYDSYGESKIGRGFLVGCVSANENGLHSLSRQPCGVIALMPEGRLITVPLHRIQVEKVEEPCE